MLMQIPATQAANELSKLLNEAAQGHEIVIVRDDGSAFKLVALPQTPKPTFGSARGLVSIGPNFDQSIVILSGVFYPERSRMGKNPDVSAARGFFLEDSSE